MTYSTRLCWSTNVLEQSIILDTLSATWFFPTNLKCAQRRAFVQAAAHAVTSNHFANFVVLLLSRICLIRVRSGTLSIQDAVFPRTSLVAALIFETISLMFETS